MCESQFQATLFTVIYNHFYIILLIYGILVLQYYSKFTHFTLLMILLFHQLNLTYVELTHQQMHFYLFKEHIKLYIKIHINIAPTCFGLRPSSGSLH